MFCPRTHKGFLQLRVPRRSQESKRGKQRTGADAGHHRELRAFSATAKTHQRTGTKGAPGAPAGERENIDRTAAPRGVYALPYFIQVGNEETAV